MEAPIGTKIEVVMYEDGEKKELTEDEVITSLSDTDLVSTYKAYEVFINFMYKEICRRGLADKADE